MEASRAGPTVTVADRVVVSDLPEFGAQASAVHCIPPPLYNCSNLTVLHRLIRVGVYLTLSTGITLLHGPAEYMLS